MFCRIYKPSVVLKDIVDQYVIIFFNSKIDHIDKDKFIPRLGESLIFNFRETSKLVRNKVSIELPKIFLIGQQIRYEFIEPGIDSDILITIFKPASVFRLFHISPYEFTGGFEDFSLLRGKEIEELYEQMAEEKIVDNRIFHLESFLMEKLKISYSLKCHQTVNETIKKIIRDKGCIRISDLCNNMSVEERTLRRNFHLQLGISAKSFARIVKFNCIVSEMMENPSSEMMDFVTRFEYFDQTHFINDFKDIFGETPLTFQKRNKNNTRIISAFE